MTRERIVLDYAGIGGHTRYTHYPTGKTCLRQPWMSDADWHRRKSEFFPDYHGLPVETESGHTVDPGTDRVVVLKERIAEIEAIPDDQIDTSDIPEQGAEFFARARLLRPKGES